MLRVALVAAFASPDVARSAAARILAEAPAQPVSDTGSGAGSPVPRTSGAPDIHYPVPPPGCRKIPSPSPSVAVLRERRGSSEEVAADEGASNTADDSSSASPEPAFDEYWQMPASSPPVSPGPELLWNIGVFSVHSAQKVNLLQLRRLLSTNRRG